MVMRWEGHQSTGGSPPGLQRCCTHTEQAHKRSFSCAACTTSKPAQTLDAWHAERTLTQVPPGEAAASRWQALPAQQSASWEQPNLAKPTHCSDICGTKDVTHMYMPSRTRPMRMRGSILEHAGQSAAARSEAPPARLCHQAKCDQACRG